ARISTDLARAGGHALGKPGGPRCDHQSAAYGRRSSVRTPSTERKPQMNHRPALVASIALVVLGIALTPAALAAKGASGGGRHGGGSGGTTGGGGSLSLVMVTDLNANGTPNWGDTVTFNVSTTATTQPNVSLTCSQNGKVVYGAVSGFYAGYPWPST